MTEQNELLCSILQGIKDHLPVTARSLATRQSHYNRLLRFARNDLLYKDLGDVLEIFPYLQKKMPKVEKRSQGFEGS